MNSYSIGHKGEDSAIDYLVTNRFNLIARNFRSQYGEIDIIAVDTISNELAFIEVKKRRNYKFGNGYESVSNIKQNKIRKTAEYYLSLYPTDLICRFDVISIDGLKSNITHIRSAFI